MKATFKGVDFEVESKEDFESLLSWADKGGKVFKPIEKIEQKTKVKAEKQKTKQTKQKTKIKRKPWNREDITRLKELAKQGFTTKQISDILGRSPSGVYNKLNGKVARVKPRWTVEDLEFMKTHSVKECMEKFNRSRASIYKQKAKHGIYSSVKRIRRKSRKHKIWNAKEDEIVKTFSPKKACASLPGRTINAIYARRLVLGIQIDSKKVPTQTQKVPIPKPQVPKHISFTHLNGEESNLLLGVIEHQSRKSGSLSVKDISVVFGTEVNMSKTLLHDVFQQWQQIKLKIKSDKKAKLTNADTNTMSMEFY